MGTFLVFVDDLSRAYTEPSDLGYNEDSLQAPFAGKGPFDCSVMLKSLCEGPTPSDLDYDSFAILDLRSLEDDTLLLVRDPEEHDGGHQASLRVIFDMIESQIMLWAAGKTTLEEGREKAESTLDGVLRPGMDI
jgi:hypothetical protein